MSRSSIAVDSSAPDQSKRWGQRMAIALLCTVLVYLGLALWVGAGEVWQALKLIPVWRLSLALAALLFSYLLLFLRWQTYLRVLGYALPWLGNLGIFVANLAMLATPGRSGEALKAFWLQQKFQVPVAIGLGATLCERLCDLLGALLLITWGMSARWLPGLLVAGLGLGLTGWLVTHPQLISRLEAWAKAHRWRWLRHSLSHLLKSLASVRQLLRPQVLLFGLGTSLAIWGIEGFMMWNLFQGFGATLSVGAATVIRTASCLGGVLSLVPGGIGTTEAASLVIALAYGATRQQALAATLLIRALTLWLPVGIGAIAWTSLQRLNK